MSSQFSFQEKIFLCLASENLPLHQLPTAWRLPRWGRRREESSHLTAPVTLGAGFSWLCLWLSPGLPTGTFHVDLPGLGQYLSCWLLPSASSFWFPFHLSLGSSHPQAEAVLGKTCFKETQAGIPGAQRSHSFNLPLPRWGKGKSSHFPQHSRLLCHFRPLWLPSHICFLRQVSHGNPQILGDTYQALQLLPLKPIYQGLRWKAYPFRPHPPWGR